MKTELVSVGVRGTEFLVTAEADATSITVFEGAVLAENAQGSLALSGGQSAVAERGRPPVLQVVARPRDAGGAPAASGSRRGERCGPREISRDLPGSPV